MLARVPTLLVLGQVFSCSAPASRSPGDDAAPRERGAAASLTAPVVIAVDAGPAALTADGRSSLLLSLIVIDGDGLPVPEGTSLGLRATLGSLGEPSWSAPGEATVTYTAGTWSGIAHLGSSLYTLVGDTRITLRDGRGQAAQLHLHGSLSEGSGTMLNHTELAEEEGLDALWWTDHDHRYHADNYYVLADFDFDAASVALDSGRPTGWETAEDDLLSTTFEHSASAAHGGERGLRIAVTATSGATSDAPDQATWDFRHSDQNNYLTLLGAVDLSFWIRPQRAPAQSELFIIVPLSRMARDVEEEEYRRIVFVASELSYESDDWTLYVPLDLVEEEWTQVEADLTELAVAHFGAIGVDLHAELVTITARAWDGVRAIWHVDDLAHSSLYVGEDLRARQREYLDGLGSTVTHHIGAEISHVTDGHGNAFFPTDDWSFLPYTAPNEILLHDAVQEIHDGGGIVSFNHVFGTGTYLAADDTRADLVEEAVAWLGENEAFGCDLLEVGYRRRVGGLEDFTEVWDRLAVEHGVFMTGIGTSDQHNLHEGGAGNDFVTWIGSASTSGEDLVADLRRGFAWFGDPDYFDDADLQVALRAHPARAVAGQVVAGASVAQWITFDARPLQAGWEVKAIVDGVEVDTWTVAREGRFMAGLEVDPTASTLVRFEVHDADEGGVLYTNPIYFVAEGTTVAAERVPAP